MQVGKIQEKAQSEKDENHIVGFSHDVAQICFSQRTTVCFRHKYFLSLHIRNPSPLLSLHTYLCLKTSQPQTCNILCRGSNVFRARLQFFDILTSDVINTRLLVLFCNFYDRTLNLFHLICLYQILRVPLLTVKTSSRRSVRHIAYFGIISLNSDH